MKSNQAEIIEINPESGNWRVVFRMNINLVRAVRRIPQFSFDLSAKSMYNLVFYV